MIAFRRWPLMLVLTLIPGTARSQTPVNSFEELGQLLQAGQTVIVTDAVGHKTRGKTQDISAASFTLAVREQGAQGKASQKTFGPGPLTARWRTDGPRNGTLTGLFVGAIASGFASSGGCARTGCGDIGAGLMFLMGAFIGSGIGAGVGAVIDLAHPVRELHVTYSRVNSPAASVRLSPIVGERKGLSLSMTF